MNEDTTVRLHAVVEGHVQGVGFRYFVVERATSLRLTGWVRNTVEGDVEVTAEGERVGLEMLLDGLRRGPRSAFVINIREDWLPATGEFTRFEVRRTNDF